MKQIVPCLILLLSLAACTDRKEQKQETTSETTTGGQSPVAVVDCNDPAAGNKIKDALSIADVAGMNEQEAREWEAASKRLADGTLSYEPPVGQDEEPYTGLISFRLDTNYNEHCLLSVTASMEGIGAYISSWHAYYNFDKHTGEQLQIKDLLKREEMDKLAAACNKKLQVNITEARNEIKDEEEHNLFEDAITSANYDFTSENLDKFYITDDKMVFISGIEFPHAMLALQPREWVEFSKQEIAAYIKPGGPLEAWLK